MILLASHALALRILHHLSHVFELLLLRFNEYLLCLLTGYRRWGRITGAHMTLHYDFLCLWILHVKLICLIEHPFSEADVLHGVSKKINANLLLLLYHLYYEFLVFTHLVIAEEVTALNQELLRLISEA
jgi:hypothetical protein